MVSWRKQDEEVARLLLDKRWPEARVVALPERKASEPRVLVERIVPDVAGPLGEYLAFFEGLPSISLFTGVGGFDIGTEQAGFCSVVQHEIDFACCQTLIHNRPEYFRHAALIQGDIYKTPTSMILGAGGLRVGEAHLLTGGPPCQGFSVANHKSWQRGHDIRNDLVFEFLRVVREAQPRFFCFENVPGFVHYNKHEYLRAFLERAYGASTSWSTGC